MSQNKLEEYMIESSTIYANKYIHPGVERVMKLNSYRAGFDAAIALDLPVKLEEWRREMGIDADFYTGIYTFEDDENVVCKNAKELFQYWIENVYKTPE